MIDSGADTEGTGMPRSGDLFDMRRLEVLSNTIFGVAMTLLASRIPTAPFQDAAPIWSTIWAAYHSQLAALLISFVVGCFGLATSVGWPTNRSRPGGWST
jgi:hypothetical protein